MRVAAQQGTKKTWMTPLGTFLLICFVGFMSIWGFAIYQQDTGIKLYNQGKYQDAGEHFRMVIRVRPSNGNAHFYLGVILSHQNHFEQAIQEFREAFLYEPDLALYPEKDELANALYATGKHAEAREIWSAFVRSPNDWGKMAREQLDKHPN